MNDSPASTDSELDWLAFQYVAGELPADDCQAFELRLADDQAACEAVARAVQMTAALEAVRAAPMAVAQSSSLNLRWRRLAGAACVAALVLLAISLRLLQRPAAFEASLTKHSNNQTASEWVAIGSFDDESADDDLELSFNDTEPGPKVETPADELDVPSWMVAALEHDHDDLVEED